MNRPPDHREQEIEQLRLNYQRWLWSAAVPGWMQEECRREAELTRIKLLAAIRNNEPPF